MKIHSPYIFKRFLTVCFCVIFITLIPSVSWGSHDDEDPIWPIPAFQDLPGLSCMANSYFDRGGKGLKAKDGEELNCTANDVEITNVVVTGVKDNMEDPEYTRDDGSTDFQFTCNEGKVFFVEAEVTVRTNADTRYDPTFYLPLNNRSPQVYQDDSTKDDDNACSLIVPNPDATHIKDSPDGPLKPGVGNDDGDQCGDIDKSSLVDDDYTMELAEFSMLCQAPPGSKTVVFEYCAAWSVKDSADCSGTEAPFGQIPSQTSKCNCGEIPINVFISPDSPTIVKNLINPDGTVASSLSDTELVGEFEYQYVITKSNIEDLVYITSLFDVIYTDPNDSPEDQIEEIIDVFDPSTGTGDIFGNVKILENNCNPALTDGKYLIDDTTVDFTCNLKVEITDGNLPDATQPGATINNGTEPPEFYWNYIYATFEDKNETALHDEKESCDNLLLVNPLTDPNTSTTPLNEAVCSNRKMVSMTNIDPEVTISKTVVVAPGNPLGLRQLSGSDTWYIAESGNVTFNVIVGNPTNDNVDEIWASALDIDGSSSGFRDDWVINDPLKDPTEQANGSINLYSTTNCSSIPKTVGTTGTGITVGGSFGSLAACQYTKDLGLLKGETYINTAKITATDNENRLAEATDSIQIVFAEPMVSIKKYVDEASVVSAEATPVGVYLDAQDGNEALFLHMDEPGGYLLYRFVIKNVTETGESILITGIDDDLYDLDVWPPGVNDTGDRCSFPQTLTTVEPNDEYSCTYLAKIEDKEPDYVERNQAKALARLLDDDGTTAIGPVVESPYDEANVIIDDVPANVTVNVNIAATLFVTITNGSNFESVDLTELTLRTGPGINDFMNIDDFANAHFSIRNDGGMFGIDSYDPCGQPSIATPIVIPKTGGIEDPSYTCAFTIELLDNDATSDNIFSTLGSGGGLSIKVRDNDGLDDDIDTTVTAKVQLVPAS